jgi:hypothetical protein
MARERRIHRTRPLIFISATALLVASCHLGSLDGLDGFDEPFSSELDTISLNGADTVAVGDTIRLSAHGTVTGLIGLLFYDPIRDGRFSVSDPTVAAITPFNPPASDTVSSSSVRVKGLRVGTVEITVSARGKRGTHSVEVTSR